MANKLPISDRGQVITLVHQSRILKNNPLGDPSERPFPVYLPAAYNNPDRSNRHFPVLFDLVGFTSAGPAHVNWKGFDENVPDLLDRLIAAGDMPPCIVAFPDCFTALGGNQYVNSSAMGRYADYLTRELVPYVDRELRTFQTARHRACFGKSSGGYGAIVHGMLYPDTWGAVGNHSGDAYFDFTYKPQWPGVLTALQRYARPALKPGRKSIIKSQEKPGFDDGRVRRFLDHCRSRHGPGGGDIMTLMMLAMAATYDPDPKAPNGFRLPYDLNTGEFLERRWARWLAHDPVHMVTKHRANLKKLRAIYIDCGWRDQFHIHFGTRQLSKNLRRAGISHRYEEFDGTHSGIDHRMEISLPYLARAIA